MKRLERTVFCALIAYPFIDYALRRIELPVLPSFWDEMVLVLGLLLAALRIRSGQAPRTSPLLRPMGMFLAVSAAGVLANLKNFSIGLEGLRADFEYMTALVIALNLTDHLAEVRRYAAALVGLGTLAAVHGIYQYATKAPMPPEWVSVSESLATRAYSIVGSPNGLGDYLALLIPLAAGLALCETAWWRRAALGLAAAVLGTGLLVTFSRGAWLALAAAAAVAALSFNRRLLLALAVGAVVVTVAVPPVTQRVDQLASKEYWQRAAVYGGRLYRWNEAYKQMAHAPLEGDGIGEFGGAVAARRLGVLYTDNYYAKIAAEGGLVGLAAFVALMVACGRLGHRVYRSMGGRRERFLALGLWGALLVVILHNTVENIFEIPFLNTYFWLAAGLLNRLPDLAAGKEAGE